MNEVIELLMSGDASIVANFKKAFEFWEEFYSLHSLDSPTELAKAIGMAQSGHERVFDDSRSLGKGTMPYTALGYLYDTGKGFDDNRELAVRTIEAFMASHVSVEVKGAMRDAAVLYYLQDEERVEKALKHW